MTNYERLIKEDRGNMELTDARNPHVAPIKVRFTDNGTAKYIVLSDKHGSNMLYIQGTMMQQLCDELGKLGFITQGLFDAVKHQHNKTRHQRDKLLEVVKALVSDLDADLPQNSVGDGTWADTVPFLDESLKYAREVIAKCGE